MDAIPPSQVSDRLEMYLCSGIRTALLVLHETEGEMWTIEGNRVELDGRVHQRIEHRRDGH